MAEREVVEKLVADVLASAKYQQIAPALVARLAAAELDKGRKPKDALKTVKGKLHQVGGVYLPGGLAYAAWLAELQNAPDAAARQEVCRRIMQNHVSTRERLPILEEFFTQTLAGLPPVRLVLDIACGLNPLALPWMGLPPDVTYHACDIYGDMVAFVEEVLRVWGVQGQAVTCDVIASPPTQKADLALILKTIPCLEQLDKDAGARLLDALNADTLLVSFPAHSIGGRQKGMLAHYEARFDELVAGRGWQVERFAFTTELAFLVRKNV